MPSDLNVRRMRLDELPLSRIPAFHDLLERWAFYHVSHGASRSEWPESAKVIARAAERAVTALLEPGLGAWLGLYGPFLPSGIVGAANVLIDDAVGGRFFIPSVECCVPGPGYVDTYMGIEWRPGFLERLLEPLSPARKGPLPCGIHASIQITPEQSLMEVGRHRIFDADLRVARAEESIAVALKGCTYLILPDLDFEMFYLGAVLGREDAAGRAVSATWA